ncbi:30S ribosomal protein S6 [Caldisalinibacter kiritimatiensis]|uniref:Small ribosomal subunit protein bS6 n=1 Tax=Caldisalinibacter kiritimatiensis TaxID=1304284 RepID=R1CTM6_9FIRM|nr:30S ribosomal protein S6 [Caldisalinibacter kiritimatiensis]EOD00034.1 SSU ribosomal protein S6p [Caldisalinibacter kiritimatiensis]
MTKYEGAFIFVPTMEEEERKTLIDRLKGIIESNGSVENVDEWGNRKLAYEIKDFKEGYYVFINFTAESDVVNELDRVSKITDSIMRHMVIREEE